MVRFKDYEVIADGGVNHSFNPTMVRFKAGDMKSSTKDIFGFNPTMVRFKVPLASPRLYINHVSIPQWFDSKGSRRVTSWREAAFQSHNGSIQSIPIYLSASHPLMFQSHNGSIQRLITDCNTKRNCKFQSHNGSIQSIAIV